jgi:hypothetical protein
MLSSVTVKGSGRIQARKPICGLFRFRLTLIAAPRGVNPAQFLSGDWPSQFGTGEFHQDFHPMMSAFGPYPAEPPTICPPADGASPKTAVPFQEQPQMTDIGLQEAVPHKAGEAL